MGESAAQSVAALSSQLSIDGLVLVNAKPLGSRLSLPSVSGRPVKLSALMRFVREFRALVGSGMPIARALAQLEKRSDDASLAAAIAVTRTDVERGVSLDIALGKHPHAFDPLTQATVRAGTTSGNLEEALDQLLSFLNVRHQLQRKIRQAMTYPVFMLILLAAVLSGLMLFVLPRFAELYQEFGAELPLLTQILLKSVAAAPIAIPAIVVTVIGCIALTRLWLREPSQRLLFDRLRLAFPVSGPILRNLGLVQISFMVAMLLRSGMTLRGALQFTAQGVVNADQRVRLERVGELIEEGKSLREGLAEAEIYPELSRSLLDAGEQAGDLERMFSEVAQLHQETLNDKLSRLIALIEPLMMLFVGLVLGGVIIAVYLPIFGISTVVQ